MPIRVRVILVVICAVITTAMLILARSTALDSKIVAAFDAEFLTRSDGYPGLSKHYGFEFKTAPLQMDPGLMYMAVAEGSVEVIDGFSTDGRISTYGLIALKDNLAFFPPYQAVPLVRGKTLQTYPEIREILDLLAGRISNQTMQQLNFRVDEQGEKAYEVARDFLKTQGLLHPLDKKPKQSDPVSIGGKHFTEQEIIGEMMAILIEENLSIPVARKLNLGGTMICFNALRSGDIDLYPEYTGTGLVNILKQEVVSDPVDVYRKVKMEFNQRYGLEWIKPLGFDNTYALVMKQELAKELDIITISDLARYIQKSQLVK